MRTKGPSGDWDEIRQRLEALRDEAYPNLSRNVIPQPTYPLPVFQPTIADKIMAHGMGIKL